MFDFEEFGIRMKMKTVKAIKARVKVTGTGKLKRSRPGKRHLLRKKTSKRKHTLETPAFVSEKRAKVYKELIGA